MQEPRSGRSRPTCAAIAEQLRGELSGVQRCRRRDRAAGRCPDERGPARGATMCVIWCESRASCRKRRGSPPHLYVLTRNAQTVLAEDPANLDQAGLRGLLRVIGTEHPQLRATRSTSTTTPMPRRSPPTAVGFRRGRDRLARRPVVRRAAVPDPLRPRSGGPRSSTPSATGCACRSARPVTSSRWSWLRSTGSRRGRVRSRSRSPRPTSTSPMCWWRSAGTRASRAGCPSWARTSPVW